MTSTFRKLRASKWFVYTAVNLAIFTDIYLQNLIVPILPFTLEEDIHVQPKDVQRWTGFLVGLYGGGDIIGSPLAGYLADKFTARRIPFMFGLVALIASTVMYSLGRTIGVLVAARLLQGISSGFTYSIGTAVTADTLGNRAGGEAMGFLFFSIAAGTVVGPVCGGALYYHFGYQVVFLSAYILMGLDLVFWLLMIEPKPGGTVPPLPKPGTIKPNIRNRDDDAQEEPSETSRLLPSRATSSEGTQKAERGKHSSFHNFVVLVTKPRMQAALLGAFMYDFMSQELSSTLPLRTKALFNFNSQTVGIFLLIFQVANFISPLMGLLSDKIGAKLTMTAGFIFLTPFWIVLRLIDHDSTGQIALLSVMLAAIGIGMNLVISPIYTEAKSIVDEIQAREPGILTQQSAYGTSFALINMSYGIGSLLGPIVGSFLVGRIGWGNTNLVTGVLCAICIIPSLYAAGGRIRKNTLSMGRPA